jgi:hypothetical protein
MADGAPLTDWLPLSLTGEPTCSWADPGGCYEASIPCTFDADLGLRLAKAEVRVEGYRYPWVGVVDTAIEGTVHAYGPQSYLDDTMREACICETRISEWSERTIQSKMRGAGIETRTGGHTIAFCVGPGDDDSADPLVATAWNGYMLRVPVTNRLRILIAKAWKPSTHPEKWRVRVKVGTDNPAGPESERIAWSATAVWVKDTGDSGNEWTNLDLEAVAGDYGLADIRYISVEATCRVGYTPSADKSCGFTIAGVWATENAAGTDYVGNTPTDVILDSLDRLPAYVIPSDCRDFITTDAEPMGQVRFEATSKESEKHAAAAAWNDYRWGVAARMVASEMTPVVIFEPHSTTPDYSVTVGPGVSVKPAAVPNSQRASIARATYTDDSGRSQYVDVTDTDIGHALVQQGRARMVAVPVDTSSEATAQAGGARKLETANAPGSVATVEITTQVTAATGEALDPADFACEAWGKLLRIEGAESESVTGRVALVTATGLTSASVTLAGLPMSVRNAIDRLIKGA